MSAPKKVYQFTLTGELIATFSSLAEAALETGVNQTTISSSCNGRMYYKTAGGFLWSHNGFPPAVEQVRNRAVIMERNGVETTFDSVSAGGRYINASPSTLCKAIKLNRPYKGTTWRYA